MTTPVRDAYDQHVAAMTARDLDAIVAGYTPDAVLIGPGGSGRGHEYIRTVFAAALDMLDDLRPDVTVVEQDDVVLATWTTGAGVEPAGYGVDTFVVRDGLIVAHTGASHFT